MDIFKKILLGDPGSRYNPRMGGIKVPGEGEFVENLSRYQEDAVYNNEGLVEMGLVFDIERWFSWDQTGQLRPIRYSMMIDGYYPINMLSSEKIAQMAGRLEGFAFDEEVSNEMEDGVQFANSQRNIFINRDVSSFPSVQGERKICIGVVQQNPIPNVQTVLDDIVPYAVSVFNHLSPTYKISEEIVEASIKIAIESNRIPVKR